MFEKKKLEVFQKDWAVDSEVVMQPIKEDPNKRLLVTHRISYLIMGGK